MGLLRSKVLKVSQASNTTEPKDVLASKRPSCRFGYASGALAVATLAFDGPRRRERKLRLATAGCISMTLRQEKNPGQQVSNRLIWAKILCPLTLPRRM